MRETRSTERRRQASDNCDEMSKKCLLKGLTEQHRSTEAAQQQQINKTTYVIKANTNIHIAALRVIFVYVYVCMCLRAFMQFSLKTTNVLFLYYLHHFLVLIDCTYSQL